jgi:hypothetical protein
MEFLAGLRLQGRKDGQQTKKGKADSFHGR